MSTINNVYVYSYKNLYFCHIRYFQIALIKTILIRLKYQVSLQLFVLGPGNDRFSVYVLLASDIFLTIRLKAT